MDIHLFHSIHRIIVEPTRTTEHTKTVIDNILTKCPERWFRVVLLKWDYMTMSSFIVQEKRHFLKLNKTYKISIKSMKNYSDKLFLEQLRSIKFPDNPNKTYLHEPYQDVVTKFLSAIDFVAQIITLRTSKLRLILTSWIQFQTVTNTMKNSNNQAGKLTNAILRMQRCY